MDKERIEQIKGGLGILKLGGKGQVAVLSSMVRTGFSEKATLSKDEKGRVGCLKEQLVQRLNGRKRLEFRRKV